MKIQFQFQLIIALHNKEKMLKYIQLAQRLSYKFCQTPSAFSINYTSLRDRLLKYPYARLNEKLTNKTIEPDTKDFLANSIVPHTVAYQALRQYNQNILKQYHQYLFQSDAGEKAISGTDIFVRYFSGQKQNIIDVLNKSSNEQQLTYYLKILFYLQQFQNINPFLEEINMIKFQEKATLVQKTYLLGIYVKRQNGIQFAQKYYEAFKNASDEQKKKAALVILSIPDFKNKISSVIVQECLKILAKNVRQMDDWAIYRTLELIFETMHPQTRAFVTATTEHIFEQLSQNNGQSKFPILHKIIKLRDKLKMDNEQFAKYIKDNPKRFNSLFFKRKISKQAFLETIASRDSRRYLPQEIKIQFVDYVVKVLTQLSVASECDSDEIIDTVKLSMKFYSNFSPTHIKTMASLLENKLIPMYEHEKQVTFWLLTLLVRIDKQFMSKQKIRPVTLKLLTHFDTEYKKATSNFDKHVNLERITELHYQLLRAGLSYNYKSMLDYDYRNVRTFQQIIYACYAINKSELPAKSKYEIFVRLAPKIEQLLKENKFRSMKHLFIVIGSLDAIKCQESKIDKNLGWLYSNIQQAIIKLLSKYGDSLTHNQLVFVKRVFSQNRSQLSNPPSKQEQQDGKKQFHHQHNKQFITYIENCIKNPQAQKNHLNDYMSNNRIRKMYEKNSQTSHRKSPRA